MLRAISAPVTEFGEPVLELAARMRRVLRSHDGIGLAAIQIGEPLRVILVGANGDVTMVNPTIISRSPSQQRVDEGCLSVSYGKVTEWCLRASEVCVEYQTVEGRTKRRRFKGVLAAVVQHECDHLDGVLFTDRLPEVAGISAAPARPTVPCLPASA